MSARTGTGSRTPAATRPGRRAELWCAGRSGRPAWRQRSAPDRASVGARSPLSERPLERFPFLVGQALDRHLAVARKRAGASQRVPWYNHNQPSGLGTRRNSAHSRDCTPSARRADRHPSPRPSNDCQGPRLHGGRNQPPAPWAQRCSCDVRRHKPGQSQRCHSADRRTVFCSAGSLVSNREQRARRALAVRDDLASMLQLGVIRPPGPPS